MNPFAMLGIVKSLEEGHPKAAAFVRNELMTGLPEDTIIEMTVTKPGSVPKTANVKLTASDIAALEQLKNMNNG